MRLIHHAFRIIRQLCISRGLSLPAAAAATDSPAQQRSYPDMHQARLLQLLQRFGSLFMACECSTSRKLVGTR